MPLPSRAFTRQKLCIEFASVQHACPNGVYVAPIPDEPLLWNGVLFVRKGPYANAVLRFEIAFPGDFPEHPPVVAFTSDIFHPLVTPTTTQSYGGARDVSGVGGAAAAAAATAIDTADGHQRLPPGGLSLRHGFPDWFGQVVGDHGRVAQSQLQQQRPNQPETSRQRLPTSPTYDDGTVDAGVPPAQLQQEQHSRQHQSSDSQLPSQQQQQQQRYRRKPHIIEVLQYIRVIFDTEAVLDTVPLDAAANPSAWHAWQTFRAKKLNPTVGSSDARSPSASPARAATEFERPERSSSLRPLHHHHQQQQLQHGHRQHQQQQQQQQPGGARRPAEWNWNGVWEDRVRRCIQASASELALFGGDNADVIGFQKMDAESLQQVMTQVRQNIQT